MKFDFYFPWDDLKYLKRKNSVLCFDRSLEEMEQHIPRKFLPPAAELKPTKLFKEKLLLVTLPFLLSLRLPLEFCLCLSI